MSNYRNVTLGLTPSTVTQVQTWINNIRSTIPNMLSLNYEAKQGLSKMGKKRYAWSKEAYEYAQLFPQILPQNRNFALFSQVKYDYETLGPIVKNLSLLHRALSDTLMQLGANYYTHGRDVYDAVSDPSNDTEPGILVVREELSKQFAAQGLANEPTDFVDDTNANANGGGNGNGNGSDIVAVGGSVNG